MPLHCQRQGEGKESSWGLNDVQTSACSRHKGGAADDTVLLSNLSTHLSSKSLQHSDQGTKQRGRDMNISCACFQKHIAPQTKLNFLSETGQIYILTGLGSGNLPLPGSSRPGGPGGGPFAIGRGICCALDSFSVL